MWNDLARTGRQVLRRWPSTWALALLVTATVLSIPAFAAPPTRPAFGISGDAATLAMLAKARAFIGPDATIRAVRGFTVISTNHDAGVFKVLFPDRFRVEYPGPLTVITALDRDEFWQHTPHGLLGDLKDGRRPGFVDSMLSWCLGLLLRVPDTYPLRARFVGKKAFETLSGNVVEFSRPDGTLVRRLVFDPQSGRLLGVIRRGRFVTRDAGFTEARGFLEHRTVDGLSLPFRLELYTVPDTLLPTDREPKRWNWDIESVVFDPPPSPEEFRKPTK
jgi:hypothetical protein